MAHSLSDEGWEGDGEGGGGAGEGGRGRVASLAVLLDRLDELELHLSAQHELRDYGMIQRMGEYLQASTDATSSLLHLDSFPHSTFLNPLPLPYTFIISPPPCIPPPVPSPSYLPSEPDAMILVCGARCPLLLSPPCPHSLHP